MPPNPATDFAGRFIGAAIAPAVLFTACALLLAGLQGKYSTLVAAMRALNKEKRDLGGQNAPRGASIERQLGELMERARLVRNSLFSLYLAILLLLLASLCAGMATLGHKIAAYLGLLLFGGGMMSMVAAMAIGFWEARRSFDIVKLEMGDSPDESDEFS